MNKIKIGDIFKTNRCGSITVKEYINSRKVGVIFDNGYFRYATVNNIINGNVKNPTFASVCGKGFVGFGNFLTSVDGKSLKVYKMWKSMIERCYSNNKNIRFPTYIGCTVCDEWLNFQNFAKWYTEYKYNGDDFELDKDILIHGNKVYSPDTCCLVPKHINLLFTTSTRQYKDKGLPVGVNKSRNRYQSSISINGKNNILGYYENIEEAAMAYKHAKIKHVRNTVLEYEGCISPKVYETLMNWTPYNE